MEQNYYSLTRNRWLWLLFLLVLVPLGSWAQENHYYDGRHINIKLANGDSIQHDIAKVYGTTLIPTVTDGKVSWLFKAPEINYYGYKDFTIADVESIDFRSYKFDSIEVRKALVEFYKAMDGDNWYNHENWCTDKPISEWYGLVMLEGQAWPYSLELIENNLSGELPSCIEKFGPIQNITLPGNKIQGELPEFIGNNYAFQVLDVANNNLSGAIPESLTKLPYFQIFDNGGNLYEGPVPEAFVLSCMNNKQILGSQLHLENNKYSGKIPQSIQQHPRFNEFWPGIIIQSEPMDISDLTIPAPAFKTKDIDGNTLSLPEIYKKNKYTLLYKWGLWCGWSDEFNQILVPAAKAYKEKGLEVIGIHYDLNMDDGLKDYMQTHEIPWNNIIAKDWAYSNLDGASIFQWNGTPNVFLVDQEGHIVFNSLIDDTGKSQMNTLYRNNLFRYLEEKLGAVDYNFYTSTDYSKDGEVIQVQQASVGNGIDLVFVGEGFVDKDIENSEYNSKMWNAIEQFFAYEPYKSLRNRFNVYTVKAISPNEEFFGSGVKHAIDEDIYKAFEYASKVPNLIEGRPMHVNVVYKKNSGGRSYCLMMEDNSYVAFNMEGVTTVINHEAGGHGMGRLLDEYIEPGNEDLTLPDEKKTEADDVWTSNGRGANIDWRSDPTQVKWSHFINDERYAAEGIGVYEGSWLYGHGVYRPTVNSMMRYNDYPFNAPSREAIYKNVMQESEGDSWIYDYETFVAFDAAGRAEYVNALNNSARQQVSRRGMKQQEQHLTAPPVFVKGTWRDVLNKKKYNNKK